MAHFKKLPQKKNEGKITYGDGIVDGIVLLAMSEVSYAELYAKKPHNKTKCSAIKVFFDKDGVHIDVNVKIHFTQCVSDMAFKIQETIRHNVEAMTEYHVAGVNVIVSGVLFTERLIDGGAENVEEKPEPSEKPVLVEAGDKQVATEKTEQLQEGKND